MKLSYHHQSILTPAGIPLKMLVESDDPSMSLRIH
jgi:hypothetical protein